MFSRSSTSSSVLFAVRLIKHGIPVFPDRIVALGADSHFYFEGRTFVAHFKLFKGFRSGTIASRLPALIEVTPSVIILSR